MSELILETAKNLSRPLPVFIRKKYKKGLKKIKHDKSALIALNTLVKEFLVFNREPPAMFNVHAMKVEHGLMNAHIKGQQVILLYKISPGGLELIGLGSHTELGVQ